MNIFKEALLRLRKTQGQLKWGSCIRTKCYFTWRVNTCLSYVNLSTVDMSKYPCLRGARSYIRHGWIWMFSWGGMCITQETQHVHKGLIIPWVFTWGGFNKAHRQHFCLERKIMVTWSQFGKAMNSLSFPRRIKYLEIGSRIVKVVIPLHTHVNIIQGLISGERPLFTDFWLCPGAWKLGPLCVFLTTRVSWNQCGAITTGW